MDSLALARTMWRKSSLITPSSEIGNSPRPMPMALDSSVRAILFLIILFRNGMRSNFVHHIVATADYPDKKKINEYKVWLGRFFRYVQTLLQNFLLISLCFQLQLRERILNGVGKCNRAMFIFDEADKLPEQLLGKSFFDLLKAFSFYQVYFKY